MITKINVPKTSIVIEIENKEIKIENMIGYDMKMVFRKIVLKTICPLVINVISTNLLFC